MNMPGVRVDRVRRVRRSGGHRTGLYLALVVVASLLIAAFFLPLPYDPLVPDAWATLQAPDRAHWFGTDALGFDVLSRTIAAGGLDIPLTMAGTGLALIMGVVLGLLATGTGKVSEGVMRTLDVFQAFPLLVLGLVFVAMMGDNLRSIVIAIAMVHTPRIVRTTRSQGLALRQSRFVEAAIAIGGSRVRVMSRHVLPNLLGVVVAQASLAAAHGIVLIAGLTYLGVGISPPQASWGAMIRSGSQHMATGHWWPVVAPGLAILVAVASFNAIAQHVLNVFEERGL